MGEIVYRYDNLDRHSFKRTDSAELLCLVSPEAMCYLLRSPECGELAGVHTNDAAMKWFDQPLAFLPKLMAEEQLLFTYFGSSMVAVQGIPFEITGDPNSQSSACGPNDVMCHDELPAGLGYLHYALPESFLQDLHDFYKGVAVCHSVTAQIRETHRSHDGESFLVSIVLSPGWVECVALNADGLVIANHYPWKSEVDVLYYAAAVLDTHPDAHWKIDVSGVSCDADLRERLLDRLTNGAPFSPVTEDEIKLAALRNLGACAS